MITVRHSDMSISVQGHACFSAPGTDIVCAGMSTAVNYLLQTVKSRKWTRADVLIKGDIVVICLKPRAFKVNEASRIIKDFVTVCLNMAKEYPHNITVMEVM